MIEVLMTFQKMCKEDYNWKKDVSSKIREYTDNEFSDIKERFSGSSYLKFIFVGKLKKSMGIL